MASPVAPLSMRTLIITPESPLPANSGSRLRVLHLARQLAGSSEVEIAALGPVPASPAEPFELVSVPHARSSLAALAGSFRKPYQAVKHDSGKLRKLVARGGWDVVQAEVPFTVPALAEAASPTVLNTHNLEAEVAQTLARTDERPLHRLRWTWEAAKTARFEREMVRRVDAVVAVTEREAQVLEGWGARRVIVVPNGVDVTAIAFSAPSGSTNVLYVGHFGYLPNQLAALELADRILPAIRAEIPEATLTLVGRDPGRELVARAGEGVRVTGAVVDVMPYLRSAGALVVPLRAGSGTRLKILEAMAAGVPVVATPLAVSGLEVTPALHALVAEAPRDLALETIRVLRDGAFAQQLARDARDVVERRYDWSVAARPLLELHRELAGR